MEIDWLVRLMGVHLVMGRCWAANHTLSNQCAAACQSQWNAANDINMGARVLLDPCTGRLKAYHWEAAWRLTGWCA